MLKYFDIAVAHALNKVVQSVKCGNGKMNIVPTVVETIMECPLCGNHKAHKHRRTFFRKPTLLLSRISTNFHPLLSIPYRASRQIEPEKIP